MSAAKNLSHLEYNQDEMKKVVKEVSQLVIKLSGIQLGEKQYTMVENRLRSRMIRLGLKGPSQYLEHLTQNWKEESQNLLSLLTTHHTYFFREFSHFEFLRDKVLPSILPSVKKRADKKIKIWSAACSRGQEVYSLSMFLKSVLPILDPGLTFEIWGTDVDPESVKIAQNGVYPYKDVKQIPIAFSGNHWARGTGEISEYVKAKETIRSSCHFDVFNLTQPSNKFSGMQFDIIFCRNVFIYFSQEQILQITKMFLNQLQPQGFLFLGISESLNGMPLPVNPVGPSVYVKKEAVSITKDIPKMTAAKANEIIRVVCVDDSPSILTLLKKILDKTNGFEVVGTASNGKEAAELMKNTSADLMTLDIHMPEMDGITYLQKHVNHNHPPVIMISSVNRENADTALRSLELGATDYIEKPSLQNLAERSEEIRTKLKSALLYRSIQKGPTQVDISFKKKMNITNPEKKSRLIIGGINHKKVFEKIIANMTNQEPHLYILVEGAKDALEVLSKELQKKTTLKVNTNTTSAETTKGEIFILDLKNIPDSISTVWVKTQCAGMVMGLPSPATMGFVRKINTCYWIAEDLPTANEPLYEQLKKIAKYIAPATSYLSITEENLG